MIAIETYTPIGNKDLRERATVTSRLPAHGLDGVDGCARRTGRGHERVGQPRRVERRTFCSHGGDDEEGGKQGSYQILGHPVPFWDKTGVGRILRNWQL